MADDQTKETMDFLSKFNPSATDTVDKSGQTKDTIAFLNQGKGQQEGSSIIRRTLVDPAVGLARGLLVGVPEAVTGIADIPTMGYAGKTYEALTKGLGLGGFREQHEAFNRLTTPETLEAQKRVSEAKGFVDTTITALQNPSAIAQTVAQSIPPMLVGGRAVSAVASKFGLGAASASGSARVAEKLLEGAAVTAEAKAPTSFMTGLFPKEAFESAGKVLGETKVGRAAVRAGMAEEAVTRESFSKMVKAALGTAEPEQAARFLREGANEAAKIAGKKELARYATIGGIAEGLITAGQNISQIRQEEPTGTITAGQAAIGAMSGALTGLIGVLGGRLAAKLGFADFDTLAAGAKISQQTGTGLGTKELSVFKKLIYGAIQEGIFEELPQSMQEQVSQNIAQGKPITDNVVEQGAIGMLAGFAQSMGVNVSSHVYDRAKSKLDPTTKKLDQDIADLSNKAFSGMMDVPMYGSDDMSAGGVGILPQRQSWWSYPPPKEQPVPPTTPAGQAQIGLTPTAQEVSDRQKKLSDEAIASLKKEKEEDVPESLGMEEVPEPKKGVDLKDNNIKEEMVSILRNFGSTKKDAEAQVRKVYKEIGSNSITKEALITSVMAGGYKKEAGKKAVKPELPPAEKIVANKPEPSETSASPQHPGEGWEVDRGAIPGEPAATYKDKVAIIEREIEGKGASVYDLMDNDGKLVGTFGTIQEAGEAGKKHVEALPHPRMVAAAEAAVAASGKSETLKNVKRRQDTFVNKLAGQEVGSTFTIAEGEHKGTWKKLKNHWKNETTKKTYGGGNVVGKLFQHADEIYKTLAKPQAKQPKVKAPKAEKVVGPQNLVSYIEKLGGIKMSQDLAGKTGALKLVKGKGWTRSGKTQVKEEGDLGKLVRKNGKVTIDELVSDLHDFFPNPKGGNWTVDDLTEVLKSGKGREIVPVEVGYETKVEKLANAKAEEAANAVLDKERTVRRWIEEGFGDEEDVNVSEIEIGEEVIYDGIKYTVGPKDSLGHIFTDDNGEDITIPFNSVITVQMKSEIPLAEEPPFMRVTKQRSRYGEGRNIFGFASEEEAKKYAEDMGFEEHEYTIKKKTDEYGMDRWDMTYLAPTEKNVYAIGYFVDRDKKYLIKAKESTNMPMVKGTGEEYGLIFTEMGGLNVTIIDELSGTRVKDNLSNIWGTLTRNEQEDIWSQLMTQNPYSEWERPEGKAVLDYEDEHIPETLRNNSFFEGNEQWQEEHKNRKLQAKQEAERILSEDGRSLQTIESERLAKEKPLQRDKDGNIEITTGASYDLEEKLARDYEDLKNQNPQKTTVDEWFQNIKDTIGDYTKDNGKPPDKNTEVTIVRDDNSGKTYVSFKDYGIGCTPEIIFEKLIKVGARGTKGGSHSGSHGIGKVVFFAYPERWSVVSISKDINSPTGYTETVMQSTGIGFLSGQKTRIKIKAKPTTNHETGTTFNIKTYIASDAKRFEDAVKMYIDGYGGELNVDVESYSVDKRGNQSVVSDTANYTLKSKPISDRPTKWNTDHIDFGKNKIDIHYFMKEKAGGLESLHEMLLSLVEGKTGSIPWQVLNKDNPVNINSWLMSFKTAKKPDFKIVINFTQTPDDDKDPEYPFFNNRTSMAESIRKKIVDTIEKRITEENDEAARLKKEEFEKALRNVGQIEGVDVFVPFIDKESIEFISNSVALHKDMVASFASLFSHFNELTAKMESLLEFGKTAKLGLAMLPVEKTQSGYKKSWTFGFMPFEELGYDGLFVSPWTMLDYFNADDFYAKMEGITGQTRAETFAEKLINTMMHEWVHVKESGHGATFVNAQARVQMLAKAWEKITASMDKSGLMALTKEAKDIYETYQRDIEELSADIENTSKSGTILRLFNGSESKISGRVRRGSATGFEANRERLSRAKRLEGGGKEVRGVESKGDIQENLPGLSPEETFELTSGGEVYTGELKPKKAQPKQEDLFNLLESKNKNIKYKEGTKEEAAADVRKSGYDFVPALRVAGKVYTAYLGDMKPSKKKYHEPIWGSIPTSVLLAAGDDIQVGYVDKNGDFHEREPEGGFKIKKMQTGSREQIVDLLDKSRDLVEQYKDIVGSGKQTSRFGYLSKIGNKRTFVKSKAAEISFDQIVEMYEKNYGKEFPYKFLFPLLEKTKTKIYLDPYQNGVGGWFSPELNEIHIGRFWESQIGDIVDINKGGLFYEFADVIAHESIHAILGNLRTIDEVQYLKMNDKLRRLVRPMYEALVAMPDSRYKEHITEVLNNISELALNGEYDELVTYGLTDSIFASWLDQVRSSGRKTNETESLWSKFKQVIRETIRNLFGIERVSSKYSNTLLDDLNDILDTSLISGIHEIPAETLQLKADEAFQRIKNLVDNPDDVGIPIEVLYAKNMKPGSTDLLGVLKRIKVIAESTKANVKGTAEIYKRPTPTTSLKTEIDDYLGEMQITEWRMTNLAKQIAKELPKPRQHAISRWMRANGDESLLKEWAKKYPADPSYKAALTLTAKEKEWAEFFKKSIAEDANAAVKAGLTRSFAINYLKGEQLFSDIVRQRMQSIVESPLMDKDPEKALEMIMNELGRSPKNIGKTFVASRRALHNAMSLKALIANLTKTKEADGRNSLVIGRAGSPVSKEEEEQLLKTDPKYLTEANYHKQGKSTRDYKVFDNPAMRGHIYAEKDEDGNMSFFRGDIVVHPDALKRINALLGKSLIREWSFPKWIPFIGGLKPGALALKAGAFAKGTMLGMSPFHLVHTGSHAVFHDVNPFNLKQIDFDKRPLLIEGVKHGLLLVDRHAMNVFTEGLAAGGLWNVLPTKLGRWVGETHEQFTKFTFENMIPRMKADVFEKTVASMEKAYAKDLASGKMTRDQLLYEAAATANNAFGGQNYKSMGRNPTFIDLTRLFLLAPDFLESRIKFAFQALTPEGRESRVALIKSGIYMALIAQMGNILIGDDKRMHWDKPFSVIAGGREWTPRSVAGDMIHLITDWRNFAYNRLNPVFGKPGAEIATGRDRLGRKIEPEDIVKDTLKGLVPIPFQGTIRDPGVSALASVRNTVMQSVGLSNYPYRTPFDREVQEAFQKRIVISSPPEDRKRLTEIRKFGDEIKRLREEGKPIDKVMMAMHQAVKDKKIYKEDVQTAYKRAKQNTTAVEMKSLQAEDLAKLWKHANEAEKEMYKSIKKTKLSNLRDRHPERYRKLKSEYPELWG